MTHILLEPVHRWTAPRKAKILEAIYTGEVRLGDVCAAHGLTIEELASWRKRYTALGQRGLDEKHIPEIRK